MGASVQNALDKSWTGAYRVLAFMDSNLILERAGQVSKWPKCKSRLIHDDSLDRFDSSILSPPHPPPENVNKRKDTSSSPHLPPVGENIGLDIVGDKDDALNHPQLQDAEVLDGVVDESDAVSGNLNCAMFRPKDTYFRIHPGNTFESTTQIMCPEHHANPNWSLKDCTSLYFPMEGFSPVSNAFLSHEKDAPTQLNLVQRKGNHTIALYDDDDVVDSFDSSRLPRRVVFPLSGSRKAVGKEINDLLTPRGTEPPCYGSSVVE